MKEQVWINSDVRLIYSFINFLVFHAVNPRWETASKPQA